MVGIIRRRMLGLRSKVITAAYPTINPVMAPPIDPMISVMPNAVDTKTPAKAPISIPMIGKRYKMAAPVSKFVEDRCILTRSPVSAFTGLATRLSILALAKQLRHPSGVD
jgi:hypothetical protein